ncbi:hypothetical protein Ami103574_03160 [Aminipila butyrica]|uniref:Flagellar hook-length control protein-like C-terminal domain-containing protein n=1 Tax=Aminipila butyrica TaxID=433296 RepID=A0A858BUB8_9FIRM|nr:flagellar hook-length control protein FliK [Aminipila butyrica]QIB68374.1 hypothetical protein Ami103574_03160 [Aminipila butyrica]
MNAGVYFQTMNSSPTAKIASSGSAQMSSGNKYSGESFKKEMDKAFDKQPSRAGELEKGHAADKRNDKVQQKEEPQKPEVEEVTPKQESPQEEVSPPAEVLAAVQMQQTIAPVSQPVLTMAQPDQELQSKAGMVAATADSSDLLMKEADSTTSQSNAGEKGEIKLPFQNSADLVKSAMLQNSKEGTQEGLAQRFAENLNQEQLNPLQDMQEETEVQKVPTFQSADTATDETGTDASEQVLENLLLKNNQLDPAKVNIKVAEAPVDTTRADAAQQLADKITYKLSQGKQEFDLELNPRNLGKVNIKMIFQNGTAELIMTTSNAKAHQLLASHADTLRSILEANTGLDSTINLKEAESNDGQFDRDNFQQQKENQQQQQEQQKKTATEGLSFVDRLRLGLVEDMEEAV